MATYKTPGVYVEEIPKLPPSIAPVDTAVPAFVGYTERATADITNDLVLKPKRIESMVEYEQFFGGPQPETGMTVEIVETTGPNGEPGDLARPVQVGQRRRQAPVVQVRQDATEVGDGFTVRTGEGDEPEYQPLHPAGRAVTVFERGEAGLGRHEVEVSGDLPGDAAEIEFRLGNVAYVSGEFATALAHYFASYRLVPNRNVLFNVARCYESLGEYVEAYRYYDSYLDGLTDEADRRLIEAAVERMAGEVGLLVVQSEPEGATIYLGRRDLGSYGTTPSVVPVEPGVYDVILARDGYETARRDGVTVARGERVEARAALERVTSEVSLVGSPPHVTVWTADGEELAIELPQTVRLPVGVQVLEIDADALHADDRRYFTSRIQPPPAVSWTGTQPFVADALDVLAEAGRVRRTAATAADIAILSAAQGASSYDARTALVILPPVSPTELAALNRRLADAGIAWRYEAPTSGEARFAPEQPDPLLRGLTDGRVRQVYPLSRSSESESDSVLIRLADGAPWAVRGERSNGGTFVLIASPLSAEATTVPTSSLMLPLIDRVTGAWTLAAAPRTDAAPGEEVSLEAGTTVVERPDGTRDSVMSAVTYRFGTDPGIYRMLRDDSVITAYAVNPPAAESDLTRLDPDAVDAQLPGWTLHETTSDGAWHRAIYRERLGRELWRPLLFALLLVLIAETLVAASGRGRRARTASNVAESGTEAAAPGAQPDVPTAGADVR